MKNIKRTIFILTLLLISIVSVKTSFEIKYSEPLVYECTITEDREMRATKDGYVETTNMRDVIFVESKTGFLSIERDTVVKRDYYTWTSPR